MHHRQSKQRTNTSADNFQLERFLPYQIRCLYTEIAGAVSAAYEKKHGISPVEWRVLATIGSHDSVTSAFIAVHASTDKVAVSRALVKLRENGCVKASEEQSDRRQKNLSLTPKGQKIYREIVPEVLKVEQSLLSGVSVDDQEVMVRVIDQITINAGKVK